MVIYCGFSLYSLDNKYILLLQCELFYKEILKLVTIVKEVIANGYDKSFVCF